MVKCPGQDMRYWKAEDIFDVVCSSCGNIIEFWKDEPMRICSSCQKEVRNPRIDLGCAKWCKFADECLGKGGNHLANPLIEDIKQKLLDLDGVRENIVRYAGLLSENMEQLCEDETACRKIETIINIVMEESGIVLPVDFFDSLEMDKDLRMKLQHIFIV